MKKILAKTSIRNKTLRERTDKTSLQKTAIHRYHYDSTETYDKWYNMLSSKEKRIVDDQNLKGVAKQLKKNSLCTVRDGL